MSTTLQSPTYLSNLHKCSNLNHVKQIQAQIFKSNLHQNPFVSSKLISAFSLCRQMTLAITTFNQIQEPNVLLYNTLIRALTRNSQYCDAFYMFFEMQRNGVLGDNFTYPFLLKACCGRSGFSRVQMIHTHVEKLGFCRDIFVPNALIDSYSKCGKCGLDTALVLFGSMRERDVVSWNSMVAGLVKCGLLNEGRRLFDEMPERDIVSWNTVLDGYSKAGEMNAAFELFEKMPERNVVSWSTMIGGYCKAGEVEMAKVLFDKMPVKNLVTWTIMISGYAEKGLAKEALHLYKQMEKIGLKPDAGTFISVLSACAESSLLGLGKKVHVSIEKSRLKYSIRVCNALVDMYSKCGNLVKASDVFEKMVLRDVVSWNSMLQGFAMHGHGEKALDLFSRMNREGVLPDGVTFVGVLCACSHLGLVDRGRQYFSMMERDYGIIPQVEHYGCIIDLLGRGGHLKEAFELIKIMPIEPNAIIWGTLLGACKVHDDVELAEEVVDCLVKLEPSNDRNYSILSNIYATADHWDKFAKVRLQIKSTSVLN